MEKADVLEMTVTYLKALQRKDCRSEGKTWLREILLNFKQFIRRSDDVLIKTRTGLRIYETLKRRR